MLTQVETNPNRLPDKIANASNVSDALKQAETYCRGCRTSSPMICVERCDVWRLKHEILSTRQTVGQKGHIQQLLNSVKSPRRLTILNALCQGPSNLKDLQAYLKKEGFYHSLSTISTAYVKPLINAGVISEDNGRYRLTFYGRKIHDFFPPVRTERPLPIHSSCYEEAVIRKLANRPKTFKELAESVPQKSLSRILMRLRTQGLLQAEKAHGEYVFYHKAKGTPKTNLSPTEKRMFNIIPPEGISTSQLSKEAKITVRRTYKYLLRLRQKKLVFALKSPRTYQLTEKGKEIAAILDEVNSLVTSAALLVVQR